MAEHADLMTAALHRSPAMPTHVAATGARFLLRFLFGAFTDPGPGKDVRDELAREPVDLALVDSMSLAGLRAAERAGVPTAVLMHTLHRYHTHAWSRGPIGMVAAVRGMRPGRLWNAADRVLVATDSGLDPTAGRQLPANVRYTGVVQAPIQPGTSEEKPLVLVSLSTIFFEGQEATLQAILDGLEGLPIRGVVTTGAVAPVALRAPVLVKIDFHNRSLYGGCMATKFTTTIRLDREDADALARARAEGHSASELVRKGLRVVAARYYKRRKRPTTGLFVSTSLKLGDESELFAELER